MKNIKKILIVLVLTIMLTTGCTRSLMDKLISKTLSLGNS